MLLFYRCRGPPTGGCWTTVFFLHTTHVLTIRVLNKPQADQSPQWTGHTTRTTPFHSTDPSDAIGARRNPCCCSGRVPDERNGMQRLHQRCCIFSISNQSCSTVCSWIDYHLPCQKVRTTHSWLVPQQDASVPCSAALQDQKQT